MNRCSELTLCPLLAKLDTLEIADWPTEDDAISLSVSPHLDRISRFKLWVGGEPHFLRELVKQASRNWPREIELVEVYGGAAAGDRAPELNAAADALARESNEQLGRAAVRVTRPFERLFPLSGALGYNLFAGRLPDGRPALVSGSFRRWIVVAFAENGCVQEVTVRDSPVRQESDPRQYSEARSALDSASEQWVDEELRLALGLIWVREFRGEDLGIELWPELHQAVVADPLPRATEEWTIQGGTVRWWLDGRHFVINRRINDYWADWRGQIHSS